MFVSVMQNMFDLDNRICIYSFFVPLSMTALNSPKKHELKQWSSEDELGTKTWEIIF